MAQDLVKQATLQEGQWGQTWHMDQCPSSDAKMICNPPQNLDYSGKKRRKEKERKRILRDYILRWKWLKSLELAQLSVLLSKEMGSWELNLISAVDRENYIPAHLDSCTVKMYSHRTYLDCSSFNSKLHVFCVIYAFNCVNYILCKEREIFFDQRVRVHPPFHSVSVCPWLNVSWALINTQGLCIEWKPHQTERDSIAEDT